MSTTQDAHDKEVQTNKETAAIQANTVAQMSNTSAMGKAFKSFSLYSIGLRMARRALQEVVSTVKIMLLDKTTLEPISEVTVITEETETPEPVIDESIMVETVEY